MFFDAQRTRPTKIQPGDTLIVYLDDCVTVSCSRYVGMGDENSDRIYWNNGDDKIIVSNQPIAPYIASSIIDAICGASGMVSEPQRSHHDSILIFGVKG